MPDATRTPHPLALQALALRYPAGDLPAADAAAFEARLGTDPDAQDALAEAVRLSAAALGQAAPAPDRSFRALIRERLRSIGRWWPAWFARRAYRGHPLAWAVLGAGGLVAVSAVGLALLGPQPTEPPPPPGPPPAPAAAVAVLPPPRTAAEHPADPDTEAAPREEPDDTGPTMAEIWADLSTPDHLEKAHDDELRWRHRLRDMHAVHPARAAAVTADAGP